MVSPTAAGIRAVLFDYGKVLSGPPNDAAKRQMEALLRADEASFRTAYWAHRDAYDRGALNGAAYWNAVARDLAQPMDAAMLRALLTTDTQHWTDPNLEMVEWAASLRRAGFRTGILSNMGDAMEAGLHAQHPWIDNFDHTTFSHRVGMAKPDARIYQIAAEGLGVATSEVLFIDDLAVNIAAARAAGMKAVQYSTHAAFERAMQEAGFGELLSLP